MSCPICAAGFVPRARHAKIALVVNVLMGEEVGASSMWRWMVPSSIQTKVFLTALSLSLNFPVGGPLC